MNEQPCVTTADIRHGNLHIRLNGYVSPDSVRELTAVIAKIYPGDGNIFIHTAAVSDVAPKSRHLFNHLLEAGGLPRERIYLTGGQGEKLCHDRGKVIHIPAKKKHCGGTCANCACKKSA
ncbi:MAG: hypothetical protein LBU39_11555 [Desulfobulbaceae bacterium]|nr:hypothetical protein [Desulfobulbaceae bacterium]